MKKLFFGLTFLIILIIGGVYTLVFTPTGNNIVAGIIEDKGNEQEGVNFKVNKFVLTTSNIEFDASVDANSNINIAGDLSLLAKTVDLNFNIDVKDLSKLQKFTNQKLNGSFKTSGTLKGDQELAILDGNSDIFNSKTNYNIKLENFEPSNILFTMKQAKIDEILYLVNQPKYASGNIDINANITNAKIESLDGLVETKITKGIVSNSLVNKDFNLKLKKLLAFKGDIETKLVPNSLITKADIFTTMANLFIKEANVDLKTMLIKSDYSLVASDLSKLFDVTQTKMRGNITINGDIKKDKDLLVNGNSKLLDGELNFKLLNNDFSANINDVEILKVLHMLYYPEVFTSKSKLDLTYNLISQKGLVEGNLINGQFKKNEYSTVINTFAKIDLTKEVYEKVILKSDINKNIIKSTINMKSNLTQIDVDPSTIDTKKSLINALVKTNLKGIEFDTKVSGSLTNPKVKVDTSKLLKSGFKQKAQEKIEETIKKNIGDKAGNLLKGFFN